MREQGRRFQQWLKQALADAPHGKFTSSRAVARSAEMSPTYLGVLLKGGINYNGFYQRPSPEMIHKLAGALGADEDAGREAAGWPRRHELEPGSIPFELGASYVFVLTANGRAIRVTCSSEVWAMLEIYSELQALRENSAAG